MTVKKTKATPQPGHRHSGWKNGLAMTKGLEPRGEGRIDPGWEPLVFSEQAFHVQGGRSHFLLRPWVVDGRDHLGDLNFVVAVSVVARERRREWRWVVASLSCVFVGEVGLDQDFD